MSVCFLLLALFILPTSTSAQSPLEYLTEDYYPFNYTDKSKIKGLSVDILHMVWEELGVEPRHIEMLPWARAYDRAVNVDSAVLFSMARTPQREKLFRWAGPIATVRFVLVAKKERKIKLNSLNDAAAYRIGTLREDIADSILREQASITRIEAVADMEQNILKLVNNRLDMVAYDERSWHKIAIRNNLSPDDFETVFVLRETPVYFAFNRRISSRVVFRFQRALDKVKARPEYEQILNSYLH